MPRSLPVPNPRPRQRPAGAAAPGGAAAGNAYRFTRLRLVDLIRDMRFTSTDLAPGDLVPVFDLPILGGGRFRSADLARIGPTLLVFGSATCPVTDSAAPGLRDLHAGFARQVRFVMVNVREAHPGAVLPQPMTADAKQAHAEVLRSLHGFRFDVAVDDLDGTLHRAFGSKPNSAYLLGTAGRVLFRAQWASDTAALRWALTQVAHGRRPDPNSATGLVPMMRRMLPYLPATLGRAGPGAWRDMWRVAPPIALAAVLMGGFRSAPSTQP